MSKTFTNAIIREVGRNYGKAISNSLLGDKHSTPVRVVGSQGVLGRGSGGRNYENKLDKLLKTYTIKGQVATFNISQNLTNYYMELVEEAQSDGNVDLLETNYLIDMGLKCHSALIKLAEALKELGGEDKAQQIYQKGDGVILFLHELRSNFVVPPEPKGNIFNRKKKEKSYYHLSTVVKSKLDQIYNQTKDDVGR